ncbi:MAG: hypothetical protein IPG16_04360 [Comamonadaceae bacterium]|nr:hypothetical protein [Comamonadaceae bacterium]
MSYMKSQLRIPLHTSPEQAARLQALQTVFAQACNSIAPLVQQTGIWNRVALHHLAYKALRAKYPAIGSQMACNVIYSVSRASRLIYQHPSSPFHVSRLGGKALPLLHFTNAAPVYFDRHTLSLKDGQLSMFTLDGRMRFQLALQTQDEARFHHQKLHEIVLARRSDGVFELCFLFSPKTTAKKNQRNPALTDTTTDELPDYVTVEEQT